MEFIFVAALWILITCICKVVFTKWKQYDAINIIPESALQIFLGFALAVIFHFTGFSSRFYTFDAHTFFAFLLPPIIFDAGYFMPNREFFENFDSIMTFAVVGTVFNTFAIGICLSVMNWFKFFSMGSTTSEMMLFASLISAVDPVAVIAVFEEMHVNKPLFVNVFGEALFNDAISVVLFGIFKSFTLASESIENTDYILGIVAFFAVSLGGVVVGVLTAFALGFATRFTENAPVIASLMVFTIVYIGYVISEIFSFSSIIAAAVCGMVVKQYIKNNMDSPSLQTMKVMTRNFAISSESLTFILLGLATISIKQHWDTIFVISTIAFCLIFRFVAILGLSVILKIVRNKKIAFNEQLIMCFGGLRGAIAFAIAVSMPDGVQAKDMFVTATLAVVVFSVVVQGMLIRPLIRILNVETLSSSDSKNGDKSTQRHVEEGISHMMHAVEVISSHFGIHRCKELFDFLNKNYLMPLLTRPTTPSIETASK